MADAAPTIVALMPMKARSCRAASPGGKSTAYAGAPAARARVRAVGRALCSLRMLRRSRP